jgi:class 3 adenylate cyclase
MSCENKCPLTGNEEFDRMMALLADTANEREQDVLQEQIWEQWGTAGAALISDMASFSSTSRRSGICHYLKLIHRARRIIGPIVETNNGVLLKCDADNCYAFFENTGDAVRASFEANAAVFESNQQYDADEQIFLSVGIDYGRVLLVGEDDYFGDPVNTASKLGEDLAIKAETLVTERALKQTDLELPPYAEHMVARISEIEIRYVRLPMTEPAGEE